MSKATTRDPVRELPLCQFWSSYGLYVLDFRKIKLLNNGLIVTVADWDVKPIDTALNK